MRFDPFRDLDRLTEQAWEGFGAWRRHGPMALDAYRHGDDLVVKVDMPGVMPDSIQLTAEKNVLTVKANRTWALGEGDEVVIGERPHGTFSRELFLGESLDSDHIRADYSDGVLTVAIPVAEKAKARRVEVTRGSGTREAIDASSRAA